MVSTSINIPLLLSLLIVVVLIYFVPNIIPYCYKFYWSRVLAAVSCAKIALCTYDYDQFYMVDLVLDAIVLVVGTPFYKNSASSITLTIVNQLFIHKFLLNLCSTHLLCPVLCHSRFGDKHKTTGWMQLQHNREIIQNYYRITRCILYYYSFMALDLGCGFFFSNCVYTAKNG